MALTRGSETELCGEERSVNHNEHTPLVWTFLYASSVHVNAIDKVKLNLKVFIITFYTILVFSSCCIRET